jgi:hypothetical protein
MGGQIVISRFTLWAMVPQFVRAYTLFLFTAGVLIANDSSFVADKLRIAYVSPSLSLSLPWVAKEGGMLAKHDLAAKFFSSPAARAWFSRSLPATWTWCLPASPH